VLTLYVCVALLASCLCATLLCIISNVKNLLPRPFTYPPNRPWAESLLPGNNAKPANYQNLIFSNKYTIYILVSSREAEIE